MRDHKKYKVFEMAHALVPEVYRRTVKYPAEERFGLQSQVRRAAVSVPTNIVEGCSRTSPRDFCHFLTISLGSATEARYLVDLSTELEMLTADDREVLVSRYDELVRALAGLIVKLQAESL